MTALEERATAPAGARLRLHPLVWMLVALGVFAVVLSALAGPLRLAQVTVNGLVAGSYFALGAAGVSLIYGVLRLVNFAHGDFLTLGAYVVVLGGVMLGAPVWVAAIPAILTVALVALGLETVIWRPMRRRRAGTLQMLLAAIGVAFVVRFTIQLFAGTHQRSLGVDVVSSVEFLGIRIGLTHFFVLMVGYTAMAALGLMLRFTTLGKQLRALSDSRELAETSGIATHRLAVVTQVLAGGLAGLAGVLYGAALGVVNPNLGFFLLLSLFAATILGGIGNPFGALAGGVALGLAQEWATLLIDARWKVAVGFLILVVMLVVRPQGILGRIRAADR